MNQEKTMKVQGFGWRNASSKSDETRRMQIERKPSNQITSKLTRSPGQAQDVEAQLHPNHKSRNWKATLPAANENDGHWWNWSLAQIKLFDKLQMISDVPSCTTWPTSAPFAEFWCSKECHRPFWSQNKLAKCRQATLIVRCSFHPKEHVKQLLCPRLQSWSRRPWSLASMIVENWGEDVGVMHVRKIMKNQRKILQRSISEAQTFSDDPISESICS